MGSFTEIGGISDFLCDHSFLPFLCLVFFIELSQLSVIKLIA